MAPMASRKEFPIKTNTQNVCEQGEAQSPILIQSPRESRFPGEACHRPQKSLALYSCPENDQFHNINLSSDMC